MNAVLMWYVINLFIYHYFTHGNGLGLNLGLRRYIKFDNDINEF